MLTTHVLDFVKSVIMKTETRVSGFRHAYPLKVKP